MTIYYLNIFNGLANAYLLLLYWGFSAGPLNFVPYIVLGACLLLHFVCTVVSLFRPKVSAVISLLCSFPILFWQSQLMGDVRSGGSIGIMVFLILVGACWVLIFTAVGLLLNKDVHWISSNLTVKEKFKPFLSVLPLSVILLYLI